VLFCKTESEENKQMADRCRSKYNDSIRRITEKEEEVKLAVEKYSLKLCQDVEAERETGINSLIFFCICMKLNSVELSSISDSTVKILSVCSDSIAA
jgi:hypothetical protein